MSPRYRQIADDFLAKISSGELSPNEKLPPIRALAAELGVNNTTVVSAYKCLEQRRAAYSVMGSGTYVAAPPEKREAPPPELTDYINFATTQIPPGFFPVDDFRDAFDGVLKRDGGLAFSHGGGYGPLREILVPILAGYGIKTAPQNIRIIINIRQGLEAALDTLSRPGDAVIAERPGASWAAAAFAGRGVKIHEFPLTPNGPDLVKFELLVNKCKPKIIFLMPAYQTPTGLCYTDDAKEKITRLAFNNGAYIIVADEYGDFFYGEPPAPFFENVIYLKSFDRILAPGLAGCMVAPEKVLNAMDDIGGAPGYIQRGLDSYFRNADFNLHRAKTREAFSRRYKLTLAAAEAFLSPYASYIKPGGGLSLWVTPKKNKDFSEDILKHKVLVSPGKLYGAEQSFRLSFASAPTDDISRGIGIIASVLANT